MLEENLCPAEFSGNIDICLNVSQTSYLKTQFYIYDDYPDDESDSVFRC